MDLSLLHEFLMRKCFNLKDRHCSSAIYKVILIGCLIVLSLVASACILRLIENPTGTSTREYVHIYNF